MTLLIISFDFQLPSMKAIHVLLGKVTKTLTVGCNYLKTAKLKRTFKGVATGDSTRTSDMIKVVYINESNNHFINQITFGIELDTNQSCKSSQVPTRDESNTPN